MKNLLFTIFLVGLLIILPDSAFARDLAMRMVVRATATVRDQYVAELRQTFVVTYAALDRLKRQDVPEMVLRPLGEIKGEEYKGEQNFVAALRRTIGVEQTKRFQDKIIENTRGSLRVDEEFIESVDRMVLQTEVPEGENPETWLREKHSVFLRNIILFAKASTAENRVRLTVVLLERYRAQGGRCGEVPCGGCPCKNCQPKCRNR